nr:SPFH domain-containing protein [Sphingomonas sp. PAMC 26621]
MQLETQETITRDGVAVRVNAVLWYRAADPARVVTSVEAYQSAVVQAAETGMRDALGQAISIRCSRIVSGSTGACWTCLRAQPGVGDRDRRCRDQGRRYSRADATRDRARGRGDPREACPYHQGGGRE